jgi:hypothetical protein
MKTAFAIPVSFPLPERPDLRACVDPLRLLRFARVPFGKLSKLPID